LARAGWIIGFWRSWWRLKLTACGAFRFAFAGLAANILRGVIIRVITRLHIVFVIIFYGRKRA
jgi:hypothetical protein